MKVRHRLWWIGLALALVVLEGCRETSRMPFNASLTEPMNWMAQQPRFRDEYIEDVVMPLPPDGGSWRWDAKPELEQYWIEDLGVEVQGEKAVRIEDWEVPIAHFACTGPPSVFGSIDCEVSVEAASTHEQIAAGSWAFRRRQASTGKWVSLPQGEISAELAQKLKYAMDVAPNVAGGLHTITVQPLPERTIYMFVVNWWQRLRTPVVVTGSLCRQIRDVGKSCTTGYRGQAAVLTLRHYGPRFVTPEEPSLAEHKRAKDYTYKLTWSPDAHQKPTMPFTRTAAYRREDNSSAAGRQQLFPEGRLGPVDIAGEVSMGGLSQNSKGIEVNYSYTIWVTRGDQGSGDIHVWVGRSAFKRGETVTEGPWIVVCTPTEQSLCDDRQAD